MTGSETWSAASAVFGSVLWGFTPLLPVGSAPTFGSIEHLFLFMPLVAAPLALRLLSGLRESDGWRSRVGHAAQRVQPFAAVMVLASFCTTKGALAGALTAAWLGMALALAAGAARAPRLGSDGDFSGLNLLAARVFLLVGAVWLLLSRLGVGPRSFGALTVLLAALHFHFSGFALQVLIAATGHQLRGYPSRLRVAHRWLGIGAIAAILLIAAGNGLGSPPVKFVGVAAMVFSTIASAITLTAVARASRDPVARWLLFGSAVSLAGGMILAGAYGLGELSGAGWIGVPAMLATHGLINALGFTLSGLLGHLRLLIVGQHAPAPLSSRVSAAPWAGRARARR